MKIGDLVMFKCAMAKQRLNGGHVVNVFTVVGFCERRYSESTENTVIICDGRDQDDVDPVELEVIFDE